MKARHAIGITINGNEVRAAFLTLVRGKARIKALESTKLDAPLEHIETTDKAKAESLNDLENAFEIHEPRLEGEEEPEEEASNQPERDKNVGQIYALLDKFQNIKANVAINSPHLTVKYDYLDKDQLPGRKKKRFKERIDIWGADGTEEGRRANYIEISDGKVLKVDYEHHPAIIDLMDEVNQFRANNLNLVLMDTNELALVDLVKEIYKFEKNELTAIVYIEQDFSRVIFLKGRDIYHITPIVHKGSMSDDVLDVIYSKMIFAQDHYFIPEINKILVAGHSSRLKAKYYFRQKFPSAVTGYLNSKKIQSDLRFKDRGLLFSRYAVPIALAWKALIKRAYKTRNKNLLPEYILERQTMPKLAIHGYVFLFLLAATAFTFSWAIVTKRIEIRKVTTKIAQMQRQIENNKSLTERVHSFDDQIITMERKIALVDSFSTGFDVTMNVLHTLNEQVRNTRDIWLTDVRQSGKKISINGIATRRDKVPVLASALGRANLKSVTRSEFEGSDVYIFSLQKEIDPQDESFKTLDVARILGESGVHLPDQEQAAADQSESDADPANHATASNGRAPVKTTVVAANGNHVATAGNGIVKTATQDNNSGYLYGLRIGAYETSQVARRESKTYKQKGYEVRLTRLAPPIDGKAYALVVGAFDDYRKAQKLSDLFKQNSGIDNTIIKYRRSN